MKGLHRIASKPQRQRGTSGREEEKTTCQSAASFGPLPVETREDDLCIHVFTASARMVGVCLTIIGLSHVVHKFAHVRTVADYFLAAEALLFLISCYAAYFALRIRKVGRRRWLERTADLIFLTALTLMVVTGGIIVYEFI